MNQSSSDTIDPEKLRELKRRMVSDKDVPAIIDFFFDEFVSIAGFMSLGQAKAPSLELRQAVIQSVMKGLGDGALGTAIALEWTTVDLPELQIVHGPVTMNGRAGLLLWAGDIRTGVLSIAKEPGGNEMLNVRFSLVPPTDRRSVN